jgi:hypothetical protein
MLLEAAVLIDCPVGAVVAVADESLIDAVNVSASAYVDLQELDEALELFFAGTLDYVDPSRVNLPLEELVRGKPLISQLESKDIKWALTELSLPDRMAIKIAHRVEQDCDGTDLSSYASALVKLSHFIAMGI